MSWYLPINSSWSIRWLVAASWRTTTRLARITDKKTRPKFYCCVSCDTNAYSCVYMQSSVIWAGQWLAGPRERRSMWMEHAMAIELLLIRKIVILVRKEIVWLIGETIRSVLHNEAVLSFFTFKETFVYQNNIWKCTLYLPAYKCIP